jgi:hypothetical protein
LLQTIGRLFRKADGKRVAEVFQVLTPIIGDPEALKQNRNAILSAALAAMLIEDFLAPLELSGAPSSASTATSSPARLQAAIPNISDWQNIVRDFIVAARGKTLDESLPAATLLTKYGIVSDDAQDRMWRMLWNRLAYRAVATDQALNFHLLKDADVCDGVLAIAADLCGVETFKELRAAISRGRLTLEELVSLATQLANENGGYLPTERKLRDMGHIPLITALKKYRTAFADVPQDTPTYHWRQTKRQADTVVAEYGKLPTLQFMRDNNLSALADAVESTPQEFSSLPGFEHRHNVEVSFDEWLISMLPGLGDLRGLPTEFGALVSHKYRLCHGVPKYVCKHFAPLRVITPVVTGDISLGVRRARKYCKQNVGYYTEMCEALDTLITCAYRGKPYSCGQPYDKHRAWQECDHSYFFEHISKIVDLHDINTMWVLRRHAVALRYMSQVVVKSIDIAYKLCRKKNVNIADAYKSVVLQKEESRAGPYNYRHLPTPVQRYAAA